MASRLLLIDDDPEITSALKRGLALYGYAADVEHRPDRALDRLTTDAFDGAIIDVMLGRESGIELVRSARAQGATLPILMLSALSDVDHRAAGLEAGADDYVVKPFHFDELVARLKVQMHRASSRAMQVAVLDTKTRALSTEDSHVVLTEREFELLSLLVQAKDVPQSRGTLFDALWATEGSSSENVVDVYIGYLRKKLQTGDFRFEIKTVRNQGFCISGQAPRLAAS